MKFHSNTFPIFHPQTKSFVDIKDPCPVFDGKIWHLYGSGGAVTTENWHIYHATADTIDGPWTEHNGLDLPTIQGSGIAAPGVIFDGRTLHMFIQTEFMRPYGKIEHLVSNDGFVWVALPTALEAIPDSEEDGIYDPHPAEIHNKKFIVYSAMSKFVHGPQPDVFIAESESGTWFGPWKRLGKILDHSEISHHNQRDFHDYEWGIEGAQLIELPDGRVLMNATCFLPEGSRGNRQRVFFAVADSVMGPYRTLGPVMKPKESGENGHSTVLLHDDELILFYQSRLEQTGHFWRYGLAKTKLP